MHYIQRLIEPYILKIREMGKSILLLGPRQTGKTTLINQLKADKRFTLANPKDRLRYEKDPSALTSEIEFIAEQAKDKDNTLPFIIIDEIQKLPILMDAVQDLIDRKVAQFLLTGSSARKLKRDGDVNLLPGRAIPLRLDPLTYQELKAVPTFHNELNSLLLDGTLPEIVLKEDLQQRELLLDAYVTTYLEEEIRAEALVRDLGPFARFLELAASESGKIVNLTKLSKEIGVVHSTIVSYYQILEDCLFVERIEPISVTLTRRKLIKAQKYLMYDLGVRRIAAHEGRALPREQMGNLFQQFVGLELLRILRLSEPRYQLKFWRDAAGPEVDWVIDAHDIYIPIEVKWTERPTLQDAKHLQLFLNEYPQAKKGFIICRTPHAMKLSSNIYALPWENLGDVLIHP